MRNRIIVLVLMAAVIAVCGATASAQIQKENPINPSKSTGPNGKGLAANKAQASVVCLGWHALCSFSTNCDVVGDHANCACWKVHEPYIVATSKILDTEVRRQTQKHCKSSHPCGVDEAPVCKAIRSGQFTVDGVQYPWVSTYSYRGWCENWNPVVCNGDWADCMSAPCTVITNPTDPERPLSCACLVIENSPFLGTQGSCEEGTVMSTIPRAAWDFNRGTFTVPPPGYEYVKGACAALASDSE